MATRFSSGPAGIPRFRRTSVLHPTLGRLGVFLGGSGELRDGVQLQLLLPARVSPPGLGGLRRGWVKQSFLDVIAWNGSLGLETRLRVGNSGNGGWDGGGVEVAPGGRRWNNSSPSVGSGVTLELGHYLPGRGSQNGPHDVDQRNPKFSNHLLPSLLVQPFLPASPDRTGVSHESHVACTRPPPSAAPCVSGVHCRLRTRRVLCRWSCG